MTADRGQNCELITDRIRLVISRQRYIAITQTRATAKKSQRLKKTIHRKDKYFKLTLNSNSPPVYSTEVKTNMAAMTKFVNRIS